MSKTIEEDLRRNFEEFVVVALDQVLKDADVKLTAYIRYVCDQYQNLKKGDRIIFNQPPRSLKSWTAKFYVAWYLGKNPSHEVMVVSAISKLSEEIVHGLRTIMKSNWYQRIFPETKISKFGCSDVRVRTTKGGGIRSTSVGSATAGFGADLILVDDPNKISDSENRDRLDKVNEKFEGEILSRFNNQKKGIVVLVQHRLDENDLSGHLSAKGYRVIALPLVATKTTLYKFHTGEKWQRLKGDILLPHSYTKLKIEQLKKVTKPKFFWFYQQGKGKDQQRPLEYTDFVFADRPDFKGPHVLSVDTASRHNTDGSFHVIQVWRPTSSATYHLVEQFRERCDYHQLERAAKSMILRYRPGAVLIENSAQGPALLSQLKARFGWLNLQAIEAKGSKAERLERHRKAIRAGKISLKRDWEGAWPFIYEFCDFPGGETDQIDATTQFLDFMATKPMLIDNSNPRVLATVALYSKGTVLSGDQLIGSRSSNVTQPARGIGIALGSHYRRGNR